MQRVRGLRGVPMRMGKVMVMLVCDRCMCVGGEEGVKVLKNNGNNWWQEANRGVNTKGGRWKREKKKKGSNISFS